MLQKLINWIRRQPTSTPQSELGAPSISNAEKFTTWIKEQNTQQGFAAHIKDGTTVYFRDDLAACYDLMIHGHKDTPKCIIIELKKSFTQADFLEVAINVWVKEANWELWYIDNNLQWLIKANENGRTQYNHDDLIQSDIIDFEFKLSQVLI